MSEIAPSDWIPLQDCNRLVITGGDGFAVGEVMTFNLPSLMAEGRWLVESWDMWTRTAVLRRVEVTE